MKEKTFPIVLVSNMPCDGSAKMNTVLLNNTLAVGQAIDYLFEKVIVELLILAVLNMITHQDICDY